MSTEAQPQSILILGMHRSGTSYLASRLQALGVDVGADLVGAQPGNPRGHFEDRAVLRFHESLIASRRGEQGWAFDRNMMVAEPMHAPWSALEQEQALALVEERRQHTRQSLWGWKEPRTALFIDSWSELLPEMKGVVIFRHPLAVHFSALRRRHWDLALFPDQVFRAYARYNICLLDAIRREPKRYLVVHADAAFADLPVLDDHLRAFLPLPAEAVGELPDFHADEFASGQMPEMAEAALRLLVPEAMASYDALNQLAVMPGPAAARNGHVNGSLFPNAESMSDWTDERRAQLIPLLESLWFESAQGFSPSALRQELAEEIGRKVRATEEWNRKAEQIFEDNARLDEERTRLGDAFAEQQIFLQKLTADFEKFWEEHKQLGNSWVRSNERVAAQAEHIKTLQSHIQKLGGTPPAVPPACL